MRPDLPDGSIKSNSSDVAGSIERTDPEGFPVPGDEVQEIAMGHLYAFRMAGGPRRIDDVSQLVARVLEEKEFNSVRPETIVSLVHESGALDRARNLAQDYAQRAKACLNGRPDSDYARALATLPDFILEREN